MLSAANNWTEKTVDLPVYDEATRKEIKYTVKEISNLDGYTVSYSGNQVDGFVIKNTKVVTTTESTTSSVAPTTSTTVLISRVETNSTGQPGVPGETTTANSGPGGGSQTRHSRVLPSTGDESDWLLIAVGITLLMLTGYSLKRVRH